MTAHMISLYGAAVAAIAMLYCFARQNRRSGWKRNRANGVAEALNSFYRDLGIVDQEQSPVRQEQVPQQVAPLQLTGEEELGFSAQMLKLRAALGASAQVSQQVTQQVTQMSPLSERELVPHR